MVLFLCISRYLSSTKTFLFFLSSLPSPSLLCNNTATARSIEKLQTAYDVIIHYHIEWRAKSRENRRNINLTNRETYSFFFGASVDVTTLFYSHCAFIFPLEHMYQHRTHNTPASMTINYKRIVEHLLAYRTEFYC